MPDENADIARRAYAAFRGGGVEAILRYLHPEIEWRTWARFARDCRVFHGHDGVRKVLAVYEENLDALQAEPAEFIEANDRVIVPFRLLGRAKGSGEDFAIELVHVWTTRDGVAVRLDVYESKADALRSTGSNEAR